MTNQQANTAKQQCQAWKLARERLIGLLNRILFSARVLRSFGKYDQLDNLRGVHRKVVDALIRVDRRIRQTLVITRTYHNLRCPSCKRHSITVSLKRGAIVSGSAKCATCDFTVKVARLNGGTLAVCPKCGSVATIAVGKRSGGTYFVGFLVFTMRLGQ